MNNEASGKPILSYRLAGLLALVILTTTLIFLNRARLGIGADDLSLHVPSNTCQDPNSSSCPAKFFSIDCQKSTTSCHIFSSSESNSVIVSETLAVGAEGAIIARGEKLEFKVADKGESPSDKNLFVEVQYIDTLKDSTSERDYNRPSLFVKKPVTDEQVKLIGLEGRGDGAQKSAFALFNQGDYSVISSENGFFSLGLEVPKGASSDLNVKRVSISSVDDQSLRNYNRALLAAMGYKEQKINYSAPNGPLWFSRDISNPVFQYDKPQNTDEREQIYKSAALNEESIIQFSIVPQENMSNVSINTTLDKNIFDSTIYQIAHDYKKMGYDAAAPGSYALLPDRLIKPSTTIKAGETTTYYLKIKNKAQITPGVKNGQIIISQNNVNKFNIPVSLQIKDFKLLESPVENFVYAQPYEKKYSQSVENVYKDISSHGLNIKYPIADKDSIKIIKSNQGAVGFDTRIFEQRMQELSKFNLISNNHHFINVYLHDELISALNLKEKTLYEQLSNENFVRTYGALIDKLNEIAKSYDSVFVYSVTDEPSNNERKRVISDRLYRIIKSKASQTWVTYYYKCNFKINSDNYSPKGTKIPSLESLIDHKLYSLKHVGGTEYLQDIAKFGFYTTYISQNRNPSINRFAHGLYAYKVSPSAIGVYAYGDYIGDPYNDFDNAWNAVKLYQSDFLLSYPTDSGEMTPTLSFESISEGIKDQRYLYTLESLAKNNQSKEAIEARSFLEAVKTKLKTDSSTILAATNSLNASQVLQQSFSFTFKGEKFDSFEKIKGKIASYIEKITNQGDTGGQVVSDGKISLKRGYNPFTINELGYSYKIEAKYLKNIKIYSFSTKTKNSWNLENSSASQGVKLEEGLAYYIQNRNSKAVEISYTKEKSTIKDCATLNKGWNLISATTDDIFYHNQKFCINQSEGSSLEQLSSSGKIYKTIYKIDKKSGALKAMNVSKSVDLISQFDPVWIYLF
ncbi:MAG: hypothetical protein BWY43_00377 [candidate division WS2 bacterium ADurb.Bin280]|uniref:Glycoside hydrolase 123 C-terminal domain-containing protein n=1 Tax=candidate division WS2 bacterium ADurb.Bin280 TaxID=1852829 RepID=A0A1V5SDU5_9BACT|nr:MAG: hypothetical protein BWY43_00377 [candidate division WS2 bacterium ADurb.Bin280]